MSDIELKPCPFCGGKPSVFPRDPEKEGDAWTRVMCTRKSCAAPKVEVFSERGHFMKAAKRWNARAALTPPEGYVLVPVEPTEAMLAIATGAEGLRRRLWGLMLAARPEVYP